MSRTDSIRNKSRAPTGQPTANTQAAGLDQERHSAAQRAAHEAEILRKAVVPASMATAVSASWTTCR